MHFERFEVSLGLFRIRLQTSRRLSFTFNGKLSLPLMPANPRWDLVFLVSGMPVPAVLDMAFYAQRTGLRTLMVVLDRGGNDLTLDPALVNFDIYTISVPYKGVDWRRVTSLPSIFLRLRAIIHSELTRDGILITSTFDLLFLARLLSIGRRYRLRHQVRDLHALQLAGTLLSRVFRAVEKRMLRRVERLILSAPAFRDQYYEAIFSGETVLLENTPAKDTWAGFTKRPKDGAFRVGFVGVIRYPQSLNQLVYAAQRLGQEDLPIKIIFAGGGNTTELRRSIRTPALFEFLGRYEYTRDICRLYANLDLIYCVYDSNDRNCQMAMPNKFYESIIAKIPIIVAKNTFVEREVLRLGIGTSVVSGDVEGLVDVLRRAIVNSDWHGEALHQLESLDATPYFDDYAIALRRSVSA